MNYVVDIDDTICIPGPTEETKYTGATPIPERIAQNKQSIYSGESYHLSHC